MKYVIYDIETTLTCFLVVLYDVHSGKKVCYKISKHRDDRLLLIQHFNSLIKRGYYFVGFNNLSFDAQVIHKILTEELKTYTEIYDEAQILINLDDDNKYDYLIPEWKLNTKNIDLYKVYHFDNKNKRTSLKWCEFSMRSSSIEEMPFDHSIEYDLNQELLLEEYCNWDVQETLRLFKHSLDFIDLRFQIQKDSNINCINYNNGKIGMELLLSKYCSKTGLSKDAVKKLKKEVLYGIPLKNLIFPYIHFKSKEFQNVLKKFEDIVWTPKDDEDKNKKEKGLFTLSYKQSVKYNEKNNYGYIYGYGGLHQCIKPGVYEDDEHHIIIDCDVASLYPSIPISYYSWLLDKPIKYQNEKLKQVDSPVIYPPQLGIEVLQVYKEEIVDVRLAEKEKPKDQQNKTIISGYKEAANIPYGKSGEQTSWFYSKRYNLTTTINGQLLISMLSERLYDLKDCIMLQNNTKMSNWC